MSKYPTLCPPRTDIERRLTEGCTVYDPEHPGIVADAYVAAARNTESDYIGKGWVKVMSYALARSGADECGLRLRHTDPKPPEVELLHPLVQTIATLSEWNDVFKRIAMCPDYDERCKVAHHYAMPFDMIFINRVSWRHIFECFELEAADAERVYAEQGVP